MTTTRPLTRHQLEQLTIATSARIGILTGSAGTGKSTTVAHWLNSLRGGYRVATPTGKAAARLQAEGILATTIHSMLGPERNGHDGDGWGFMYGISNPLPASVIVIDEAFMPGTELMADLFRAVRVGTRLLFVGDPNQLPPVGHGCPVYDMLQSGVIPHGHLSEVHRFAGRIAHVANQIKDGKAWQPSERLDLEAESAENLRHVEAANSHAILDALPKVITKLRDLGFDPIEDMQVICAKNESGELSRKNLNPGLQAFLNPTGESVKGIEFKSGDKILCLKNATRKVFSTDDSPELDDLTGETVYVANGEIGRVSGFAWNREGNKPIGVIARFCGKSVLLRRGELHEFSPAYAVTCHKMQGSQSPVVIVLADDSSDRIASRPWWYTGITRAAKVCVTIGRMGTILRQCQRVDLQNRKTFLREDLQARMSRRDREDMSHEEDELLSLL